MPQLENPSAPEMKPIESAICAGNQETDCRSKSKKVSFDADRAKVKAKDPEKMSTGDKSIFALLENMLDGQIDSDLELKKSELKEMEKKLKSDMAKLNHLKSDRSLLEDNLSKMREDIQVNSPDENLINCHKESVLKCVKLVQQVLEKQSVISVAQSDTLAKQKQKLAVKSSFDENVYLAHQSIQNGLCPQSNRLKELASRFLESKYTSLYRNHQARQLRCSKLQEVDQLQN